MPASLQKARRTRQQPSACRQVRYHLGVVFQARRIDQRIGAQLKTDFSQGFSGVRPTEIPLQ